MKTEQFTLDFYETGALESGNVDTPPPLDGKFQVIYADPPWRYEFAKDHRGDPAKHYDTMEIDEICAMEVPAADDCMLYMWATAPKLDLAFKVIEAWGFKYITSAVWVKDKKGLGYHFRCNHELLLVARRGNMPAPPVEARENSVFFAKRGAHSVKPVEIHKYIENAYPNYSKCELFARRARDGWSTYGNEVGQ